MTQPVWQQQWQLLRRRAFLTLALRTLHVLGIMCMWGEGGALDARLLRPPSGRPCLPAVTGPTARCLPPLERCLWRPGRRK